MQLHMHAMLSCMKSCTANKSDHHLDYQELYCLQLKVLLQITALLSYIEKSCITVLPKTTKEASQTSPTCLDRIHFKILVRIKTTISITELQQPHTLVYVLFWKGVNL